MSLEPGQRVGRYTIQRLIAQGGMAAVYRADQDLAGGITRPVAVKVIRTEYSESEDFRQMFLDEARTACTLSHPNIVHTYEVGESDEGLLFMVMELVPGETLATISRTLRQQGERFSDEALFSIGILCSSALEAVHALDVEGGLSRLVHRDVSPHNLLLAPSGALKLIDFGIAKAATNRNLTLPGMTKGKAGYFSPEQAMGKKLDGRSDLFSLGISLYKLGSGRTPFDIHKTHLDRHAALVRGSWKPLHEVAPELPTQFCEVVTRVLAVKPEDRFQTAGELREALERAAFEAQVRVGPSSLIGYLDEAGEVLSQRGRVRTTPSRPAPAAATPAPIERSEPSPPNRRIFWFAGLFLAALIGAAFAVVRAGGAAPAEPYVPPPPSPEVVPTVVKVEPAVAPPAEEFVTMPEVELEPTSPSTPKVPKHRVTTASPKPKPSVPEAPSKPDDSAIPPGQGKLVISVGDNTGRHSVTVQGDDWGTPPLKRKIGSGVYQVTVKLEGGATRTTQIAVWPDKTTEVRLDPLSLEWSTRRL